MQDDAYFPKHIHRWTMPGHYCGEVWPNYYSAGVDQSRDSDPLARSNFAVMLDALDGENNTIIVVRETHWAVGWVEWIAIRADDSRALETADRLRAKLDNYPVLDEEHWSNLWIDASTDVDKLTGA